MPKKNESEFDRVEIAKKMFSRKEIDKIIDVGMGFVGGGLGKAVGGAAAKFAGKFARFAGKYGVKAPKGAAAKRAEWGKKAPEQKARLKSEKEVKDFAGSSGIYSGKGAKEMKAKEKKIKEKFKEGESFKKYPEEPITNTERISNYKNENYNRDLLFHRRMKNDPEYKKASKYEVDKVVKENAKKRMNKHKK